MRVLATCECRSVLLMSIRSCHVAHSALIMFSTFYGLILLTFDGFLPMLPYVVQGALFDLRGSGWAPIRRILTQKERNVAATLQRTRTPGSTRPSR
jgi:hypothetical protein